MATGEEMDKKGRDDGQKLDEQERKLKKIVEYLKSPRLRRYFSDDDLLRKRPSKDSGVIKAVDEKDGCPCNPRKSAPKRRVNGTVNAELRGRSAENNATAKERYAKTERHSVLVTTGHQNSNFCQSQTTKEKLQS
ncbi:hypothetical protein AWC38_SpisGene24194 [Stylophora pistillata]|uniref:Uncharacterized protein n=1 Tax=Stylophora pistillata TaxID=50429 RepID=A0A2B4R6L9_STYPI|nr:hypothetical protein AWC38_SpisGene24194 [Stylophora pistillata]